MKTLETINPNTQEELSMKLLNRRNGKVSANVTFDEKCKTYLIEFEDGTNTVVSGSTIKRWYVEVEEAEEAEPGNAVANEIANDFEQQEDAEKELTDEQYAQIGKEIQEEAKQRAKEAKAKAKKQKKAKKEANPDVQKLVDFICAEVESRENGSVGVPDSEAMQFRALKVGKKQISKLMWTKQSIRLYFRCEVSDIAEKSGSLNYNLPNYAVFDKLDKTSEKAIKKLLDRAIADEGKKQKAKADKKASKSKKNNK